MLLSTFHASAQMIPLKNYTEKDGLISTWINAIAQDSKGYLWVGTGEGFSRFNGEQEAGYQSVEWNATNFATGVYFYRVTATEYTTGKIFSDVKQMMLAK